MRILELILSKNYDLLKLKIPLLFELWKFLLTQIHSNNISKCSKQIVQNKQFISMS